MAGKRANGEGCISKEKSGRYRIAVSVWVDGKMKRRTRTAWKHADAVALLTELRGDALAGIDLSIPGLTVKDYLTNWLKTTITVASGNFAENTVKSYGYAVNNHVIPTLGQKHLRKLTASHIEQWQAKLIENEVGARTRQNAFKVLSAALDHARRPLRLYAISPMEGMATPKHEPEEIFPFELPEATKLMKATEGTRNHALIVLATTTGMRSGELFGLRRENVDLDAGIVHIVQQAIENGGPITMSKPKSKKSLRSIELIPLALEAIKKHLRILKNEGLSESEILFPSQGGCIESRANFRNRVWQPLLKKLKLKHRGMHHCRHTYATLALGAGVPITVVSQILGHSKISITYDIYGHVLKSHKTVAHETMSKLFG